MSLLFALKAALLLLSFALALPADHATDTPELAPALEQRNSVPSGFVAKPYYPTPPGGWVANWTDSYAKAQAIVGNMTLAEKVNLTTGTGYFMVS